MVYRTGLTGNRLNSNPNSKSHVQPVLTSIPTGLTGLPAGMTGLGIFYFFNSNLNFELGPVDRFTGRFDRFTGRYDRFGNFYFLNSNLNFELGPV